MAVVAGRVSWNWHLRPTPSASELAAFAKFSYLVRVYVRVALAFNHFAGRLIPHISPPYRQTQRKVYISGSLFGVARMDA